MSAAPAPKENPLHNFLLNVLVPVIALGILSKESGERFWHLGPVWGMVLAVLPPLGYGVWFFLRHRRANAFSVIGLASVALTGGITLLVWQADGTLHPRTALFFALKEASMPLVLGLCVLLSHRTATPLVRVFLYNNEIFDVERIDRAVRERGQAHGLERLLWRATLCFSGAFLMSTAMNFGLTMYFLGSLDVTAPGAREAYNAAVGRQTFWGFFVIGLPVLVMLVGTLAHMLKQLAVLTGLGRDDLLVPR